MGMTDKQFKAYIRLLMRALEKAVQKESKEDTDAEIKALMSDLQGILED